MTELEMIQAFEGQHAAWRHFRMALQAQDREAFDLLWRLAKRYAGAAATTAEAGAMENVLMAMMVGLARELQSDASRHVRISGCQSARS